MLTFSAAALDRSLKPGNSKPPEVKKTFTRPQMSPSLYATPNEIPLSNSPSSSFPPSPYMVINHQACRPGLFKSISEVDVEGTTSLRKSTSLPFPISEAVAEDHTNGVHTQGVPERPVWDCSPPHANFWNDKSGRDISNDPSLEWESYLLKPVRIKVDKERVSESVRFTSNTEIEGDAEAESSHKLAPVVGEFYDACDELSTDSGTQSSANNIGTEVRDMRLGLLMEVERRRQAEESLEKMHVHWRRLREQLADVGRFLPLDPTSSQYSMNVADEFRFQLEVARFVSDSLGSDLAKAEVEMEMESELEAKNFEITRLSDRLHYYETVNQEMSQRNQEAIEVARQDGQRRKRRQRWVWGSIAATITLGSAVLAWPYLPARVSSFLDVAQPQRSPIDLSKAP